MQRNPRYDILFEPVRIGPVVAPNRFYQTPHATGMGYLRPQSSAALRRVKAEGGWGVVCTEYCSIHPSSDDTPFGFISLWDEDDVKALALTADAIHAHGSLAAVELWHGGTHSANRMTRIPLIGPSTRPAKFQLPTMARAMDKQDIRDFRGWQREAALRAKRAGFDIVYVYAGHDYLPFQFLSRRSNDGAMNMGVRLKIAFASSRKCLMIPGKRLVIAAPLPCGLPLMSCMARRALHLRVRAAMLSLCWLSCLISGM